MGNDISNAVPKLKLVTHFVTSTHQLLQATVVSWQILWDWIFLDRIGIYFGSFVVGIEEVRWKCHCRAEVGSGSNPTTHREVERSDGGWSEYHRTSHSRHLTFTCHSSPWSWKKRWRLVGISSDISFTSSDIHLSFITVKLKEAMEVGRNIIRHLIHVISHSSVIHHYSHDPFDIHIIRHSSHSFHFSSSPSFFIIWSLMLNWPSKWMIGNRWNCEWNISKPQLIFLDVEHCDPIQKAHVLSRFILSHFGAAGKRLDWFYSHTDLHVFSIGVCCSSW